MRKLTDTKRRLLQSATEIKLGYLANGQSLRYLAEIYDTSAGSIRALLIELGVELKSPGRPKTKEK
jgi:hypothetical protein